MGTLRQIMLITFMLYGQAMLAMSPASAKKLVDESKKSTTPTEQIRRNLARLQAHKSNAAQAAEIQKILTAREAADAAAAAAAAAAAPAVAPGRRPTTAATRPFYPPAAAPTPPPAPTITVATWQGNASALLATVQADLEKRAELQYQNMVTPPSSLGTKITSNNAEIARIDSELLGAKTQYKTLDDQFNTLATAGTIPPGTTLSDLNQRINLFGPAEQKQLQINVRNDLVQNRVANAIKTKYPGGVPAAWNTMKAQAFIDLIDDVNGEIATMLGHARAGGVDQAAAEAALAQLALEIIELAQQGLIGAPAAPTGNAANLKYQLEKALYDAQVLRATHDTLDPVTAPTTAPAMPVALWKSIATPLLAAAQAANKERAEAEYTIMRSVPTTPPSFMHTTDLNKLKKANDTIAALQKQYSTDVNPSFNTITIRPIPADAVTLDDELEKALITFDAADKKDLMIQVREEEVEAKKNRMFADALPGTLPTAAWKDQAEAVNTDIQVSFDVAQDYANQATSGTHKPSVEAIYSELATFEAMVDKAVAEEILKTYPGAPTADDKAQHDRLQDFIRDSDAIIGAHDQLA